MGHDVTVVKHQCVAAANRRRRGLTLVEVTLTTAVMAVLVGGMASAVLITATALPDDQDPVIGITDGAAAVSGIATDVYGAVSFTERSTQAVTFTVADRDGNGTAETIRYAWSGVAGDPLTRAYNGGPASTAAPDVYNFQLTYDLKSVTEQPPPTNVEGPVTLLVGHTTPSNPADFPLTDTAWIGQYFLPVFPAGAVAWKVTSVSFMAQSHGPKNGVTAVQLRLPVSGGLPGATVLEETTMNEADLVSTYTPQVFAFTQASGLSPSRGLCLVLARQVKDANLADIQYDASGGTGRVTTANAGGSWSRDNKTAMTYSVYGTVTTTQASAPITRQWVRAVRIVLQVGAGGLTRLETSTPVLNTPEVTIP